MRIRDINRFEQGILDCRIQFVICEVPICMIIAGAGFRIISRAIPDHERERPPDEQVAGGFIDINNGWRMYYRCIGWLECVFRLEVTPIKATGTVRGFVSAVCMHERYQSLDEE